MSTSDPRILMQALDDLGGDLAQWSNVANETLLSAYSGQRQAQESVERGLHETAIIEDQAERDAADVQTMAHEVARQIDRSTDAIHTAQTTLSAAQSSHALADSTLHHWQQELQQALEWLARAKARLAEAFRHLDFAEQELVAAKQRWASAQDALSHCKDEHRRPCWKEQRDVTDAHEAVSAANMHVAVCQAEVVAAHEEVAQAQARVNCCTAAVGHAQTALDHAVAAERSATEAANAAERSQEYAQAAQRAVGMAQEHATEELAVAAAMRRWVTEAVDHTASALSHVQDAERGETSAQQLSTDVRHELTYRIERLQELNQTSTILQ